MEFWETFELASPPRVEVRGDTRPVCHKALLERYNIMVSVKSAD